jgi:hypothetical protein
MTAPPDDPAMRIHLVLAAAALSVSCASSSAPTTCDECVATDCPQVPVPAPSAGVRTIQVFPVADLVTPPGDPDRIADLASNIRADLTFLVGDLDSTVDAHGTSIVVVSTPHVLARVSNHLSRKRAGVSPNWL